MGASRGEWLPAIAEWLGIPEGQGGRALRMLSTIFAMGAALVMMKAAQSGIFLAAYDRTMIPWAFAASALTLALASSFTVSLAPRLGVGRLSTATVAASAVALLALRLALIMPSRAVPFIVYVVIEAASGVLVIQVWSVAVAATDARSSRRLLPVAGVGAGLAWTIGGLLVKPLAHTLGSEALLLVAPLMLGLCVALIIQIRRRDLTGDDKKRAAVPLLTAWRSGFGFVASRPLMRLLAALSMLALLTEQFMDYHLMGVARAEYGDAEAISGFFGAYYGATSALSLVFLLGLSGRVLAGLGPTRSLLLTPVTIVGTACAAVLAPGLATAVALRGSARVLKQSVWSSAMEQLQTPLSGVRRSQAKSAIRGVLSPAGYGVAAVGLTFLPDGLDPRVIAAFALVTASTSAWVIARYARRTYTEALHRAVDERRWELGQARATSRYALDAETCRVLGDEVDGEDVDRAALAAEILGGAEHPEAARALVRGLDHPDAEVRGTITTALTAHAPRAIEPLAERLEHEPEATVRLAIVRALGEALDAPRARAAVEVARVDVDPRVAHQATLLLARADHVGRSFGEAVLPLLSGDDDRARVLALDALDAEAMEAQGVQSQLTYILEKGSTEARLAAAHAAVRTTRLNLLPDVVRLLKDPRTAHATADALVSLSVPSAVRAAGQSSARVGGAATPISGGEVTMGASISRLASRIAGQVEAPPAGAIVKRLLLHDDVDIRRSATRALARSVRDGRHPALDLETVLPLIERDAARAYRLYCVLAGLARDDGTPDWTVDAPFDELAHEVELLIEEARLDVLQLLSLKGRKNLVSAVRVARRSPSAARDAQVAELLEMHLDRETSAWVVPLFERVSLRARIGAAEKLGVLDGRALRDPLDALVELGDAHLLGFARLAYAERFTERWNGGGAPFDETMLPLFERMRFLRSVPLFRDLAGDDLRKLAEMVGTVEFADGAVVFEKGEPGDALYVVLEGEVAMLDGDTELARMGPPEFFGELALLDQQPRMAGAICRRPTRLIRLRGADLDELMAQRPQAMREIIRVLVQRLRATSQRMSAS